MYSVLNEFILVTKDDVIEMYVFFYLRIIRERTAVDIYTFVKYIIINLYSREYPFSIKFTLVFF